MSKLYEALKKIEKKEEKKEKRNENIPYLVHHRTTEHWIGGIIVFIIAFIVVGFILTRTPEKRKVVSTGVKPVQQKKVEKVVKGSIKSKVIKTPPKQTLTVEKIHTGKKMESVKTFPKKVKKIVLLPKTSVRKISKVEKSALLKKEEKIERVVKKPARKKRRSAYDITALSLKAQRATERGEIEKAENIYKKLLRIRKSDVYLMNNLGALYVMEGKYTNAQQILKKAYGICTDIDIALNYANALYKGGNKRTAQTVLKHINPLLLKTEEQKESYEILKHLLVD